MKQKTILILSALIICAISCNNNVDKMIETLDVNSVKLEQLEVTEKFPIKEIFATYHIEAIGDYILIFNTNNPQTNKFIYLYDKDNMEFLGSYIFMGKGNGEAFIMNPMQGDLKILSDSTFVVRTNVNQMTEYVVNNDGIRLLQNIDIFTGLAQHTIMINENTYIGNDPNIQTNSEYVIHTKDSKSNFTRKEVGEYPKFDNGFDKPLDKYMKYDKKIISIDNNVISFYKNAPLIRVYNHKMELKKEYILEGQEEFKITEKYVPFFNMVKYNEGKISAYLNKELLLFNDKCKLKHRFKLDLPFKFHPMIAPFCFDNEYIYFLDTSAQPNFMYKIKYD